MYLHSRASTAQSPPEPNNGLPAVSIVLCLVTIVIVIAFLFARRRWALAPIQETETAADTFTRLARGGAADVGGGRKKKVLAVGILEAIPVVKYRTQLNRRDREWDIPDDRLIEKENCNNDAGITEEGKQREREEAKGKREKGQKEKQKEKEKTGEVSCPVCTEDFVADDDVRILPPCRHTFHQRCIDVWLLGSAATCPVCRVDLNEHIHVVTGPALPLPSVSRDQVYHVQESSEGIDKSAATAGGNVVGTVEKVEVEKVEVEEGTSGASTSTDSHEDGCECERRLQDTEPQPEQQQEQDQKQKQHNDNFPG
ncbi:hypothetical protein QBC46DRAFT_378871 [Diplogelasinospora grovesii]|uniref:RING-type domain-containing protein n=1 Tax=Diplogelasinospora grovesii TaxID=303347 RepID=A0AAN6S6D7_9PEZI|nr:hypothetical protein QBC46DRAFT_378871 [Diplogelasinospora grovesii]